MSANAAPPGASAGAPGPPDALTALPVGPGVVVRVRYRATDAEGEPILGDAEELDAVVGYGQLLPAIERALDAKAAGDRVELTLTPADAFGERDEGAVLELERDELPADACPGDRYEVEAGDGTRHVLQVLEVADDHAIVDLNHPLAGQEVTFRLELLAVRAATAAELAAAEARLEAGPAGAGSDDSGLIPAERLLRPGGRRYESAPPAGRRGASAGRPRRRRP